MISGLEFPSEIITSSEKKYIDKFYESDSTLLSDSINYYGVLFSAYLISHGDKKFQQMNHSEQNTIIQKEETRFQTAMKYAFNKGHQIGFSLLLMSESQEYDQDFFTDPNSRDDFLYTYDNLVTTNVFEENIRRDAIDRLIRYTRRNFENGYKVITDLGTRFFKKGIAVAFDDVRKYVLQKKYKISGYSQMLNVPYNQDFTVTPAFKATFAMESSDYEEWDLHWDATYGFNAAKGLVAKVMIHRLNLKTIRKYAKEHANTYAMLNNFVSQDLHDDEVVYLVRIDFLVVDTSQFPRLLQHSEYTAIELALKQTISRRLKVDNSHLFITD